MVTHYPTYLPAQFSYSFSKLRFRHGSGSPAIPAPRPAPIVRAGRPRAETVTARPPPANWVSRAVTAQAPGIATAPTGAAPAGVSTASAPPAPPRPAPKGTSVRLAPSTYGPFIRSPSIRNTKPWGVPLISSRRTPPGIGTGGSADMVA